MKSVYTFGNGSAEGRADMKNLLGGKGANLAEMNLIGVPVPPGFTITTEVCTTYTQEGKDAVVKMIESDVQNAIKHVEDLTGNKFNEYTNASTTELIDVKTNTWSNEILDTFGIKKSIFRELSQPGTKAGKLLPEIKAEVGYDLDVILAAAKQLANSLCLGLNGAGRCLLDQNIAGLAVFKGKQHQIHRFVQAHNEPGHGGLSQSDGAAASDLVDPQRDYRATGAHHVAVACAADLGGLGGAGLGNHYLFHHRLGGAHSVDGIGGLVGREAYHILHTGFNGGGEHILGAQYVSLHRFDGEKLAGGHLLQCCRVENVVHPVHGVFHRLQIPHVTNVKADLVGDFRHSHLKFVTHIVLLLLVTRENADLANVRLQKPVQHSVAKRPRTPGDQ